MVTSYLIFDFRESDHDEVKDRSSISQDPDF